MTDKYKNLIGSIRTLSDGIETRQEYDTLINKIKNIVNGCKKFRIITVSY